MKNFIQPGRTLTAALAQAVTSGQPAVLGDSNLPAIAAGTYAAGESGEYAVVGVYELTADAALAGVTGDAVYLTGAGVITATAQGNTAFGVLAAPVTAGDAIARVRLPGQA